MKHVRNRIKISGFTLMEILVTITIVAIISSLGMPLLFERKSTAINYAKVSLQHAKSFLNMINNNYAAYYNQAQGGVVTIPYSSVISAGYNMASSNTDIYGSSPCAAIKYNANSKNLDMIMYYTNSNTTSTSKNIVDLANDYLNGVAGQITGNTVISESGEWSLPTASSLFSGINSCAMHSLPNNGLVINLNMLTTQISLQQTDIALHRTPDTSGNVAGSTGNTNTMQTDIAMSYTLSGAPVANGIFLTNNNFANTSPYLTTGINTKLTGQDRTNSESDLVFANTNLIANSFQPSRAVAVPMTPCVSSLIGQIVRDSSSMTGLGPVSDLQCIFDQINCLGASYCYSPMLPKGVTTLHPNTSSFTCPANTYVDLDVPPVIVQGTAPNATCTWVHIGPPSWTTISTLAKPVGLLLIRGITASTIWMVQQPQNTANCTNGAKSSVVPAIITDVTCAQYLKTYAD